MTQPHDATTTGDGWYILELLGHRKLAGHLTQTQLAGNGFFRVDIPPAGTDPGRTQFVAPGSVYALHPVTEDTARAAATAWRPAPVQRWELPTTPAPATDAAAELPDDTEDYDAWPGDLE